MRLVTRSDFDGLACATLLKEAGVIDSWKFAHPKDLQDGIIEVTKNDVLANVPFVEGCGLWFDHHSSEFERNQIDGKFIGESRLAPSCARIIFEYYGGEDRFPHFLEMMEAVDKVDSGHLSAYEILHPNGWILVGFIMDPRTGLGRFRNFRISNYQLMEELIDYCRTLSTEEILALPDVIERIELYKEQADLFIEMVHNNSRIEKDVIITDLRGTETIYSGNRFMIYSLYPEQNISVWIVDGKGGHGCSAAVGHSVLNRTSDVDVGKLMLKYGGGGHRAVGTCQFTDESEDVLLPRLIDDIVNYNQ